MNVLTEILANKRREIGAAKRDRPLEALRELARSRPAAPSFAGALASVPMALIAEVKHRSPSAGVIRTPFDPAAIARCYADAGAQAVSVLMDRDYFGGGEESFRQVRDAVTLPLLYKEFVVDDWQVWHARALGASALLLIAAALPETELASLQATCAEAGLDVLFEVHDEAEMETARRLNAPIVGVNNRDLRRFVTSLDTTLRLSDLAPEQALLISESGIRSYSDIQTLQAAGVGGVLVGESLLREPDLHGAVKRLMNGP